MSEMKKKSYDGQQLEIGQYTLHLSPTDPTESGYCYVVADPSDPNNPNKRIEHWGLLYNFKAPGPNYPQTQIYFVCQQRWTNLQAYFLFLQQMQATYIAASCVRGPIP